MDRIIVRSSNLLTAGYDAAAQVMEIEFQNGSIYQYFEVPEQVYQGLLTAESKGQYLHDQVFNRFRFAEV